ncbi:MAG: hypothetical protein OXN97_19990 [Bryobacterales bacterium]|nr:hypothetical protein [Bryobacterales bacterium]
MIRNRVRWGFGLMALLLALTTVACGGDEPAPVVQPPAPPPAPPPFQPQAVEVALGESGNVTLMTTEDGGFTLNGEAFESGGTVAAENGNMYLLTLADGKWSAAYQASEAMVTLGITEEMVTLTKNEDGSYMIGDMAVTSGETTVTAENGNMYTLSMDEDGMWMATYVEPVQNVMLGTHGGSTMIKKSEDGSYWLGDMTVMNGTVVSGEGGREYTLMMGDDGMWMATFVEHVQTVMLGTHGGSTMVKKSEDGSYWVGDMTVMDGSTVTGEGGRMYTLMMGDDGMWMATYVEPVQTVMLGMSGTSVMIKKSEDGSDWLGDQTVMTGSTATAMYMGNTNTYSLTKDADGNWSATYVPAMGTVALGASGITIPAMRAEAGAWSATHPQTGETVMLTEGGMVTAMNAAGNTNTYMLSSDGMGMWTASYQAVMVSVMLGTSGNNAMLTRAEDGSYWYDGDAFMSGDEVHAENGNHYILTMAADGSWSAMFEPMSMEIMGAGIMAYSREDDDMYDVESAGSGMTLPATGTGNITTSAGAMYRVRMDDGMLTGVRYDGAPKGDTVYITVGLENPDLDPDVEVTYIADDRDTAANEAGTKLTVAGENIALGDLLGTGMASKAAAAADGAAGEFVKAAVETLTDLLTEAELYAKYQAAADDDAGRGAFDGRLNSIADRAQGAVNMIFGDVGPGHKKVDIIDQGTLPEEDTDTDTDGRQLSDTDYIRATQTVRGLNRLLDALSSADAFVDALAKGNNGVFEDALDNDENAARKAFSANKSEYAVYFGTTQNTRYGAIALKQRLSNDPDITTAADGTITNDPDANVNAESAAIYDLRYAFDGAPSDENNEDVGRVGAFSYANVNDTLRARNLPQTGGAVYSGGTVAVTPAGTLYRGDMRVDVNFRQQSVLGRVSDLRDKDNNLWKYLDSDVATIYLPRQDYNNLTQFGGANSASIPTGSQEDENRVGTGPFGMATVVYADSQGFSSPTQTDTKARFAGRFIGTDGAEITGTWSLGQPEEGGTEAAETPPPVSNPLDVIYGSYGVTRQDGAGGSVGPADGTAGGAAKTTVVMPETVTGTSLGAMFAGDTDVAGILRLGKRSTGGGKDANNDFDLTNIFASPGADPKKTVSNSPKHVAVVVEHIKAQRAIYVIYAEEVGGDSADTTDLANVGRQNAWKSINDFVLDHIFDNPLTLADTDESDGLTVTNVEDLSTPLGSYMYPTTRTGRPDDQEALDRIDALLAAFDNVFAFEDALKDDGGGVFDSQPVLDTFSAAEADTSNAIGWARDPFPLNDEFHANDEGIAEVFNRVSSQTQLFSLSTDYTRFGVWYRRETASAVHDWSPNESPAEDRNDPVTPDDTTDDTDTGSTSPGSYAYSWLDQSAYRTDRPVATYPRNGLATYEGKTLALVKNTHIYVGDALVRVNWEPLADDDSTRSTVLPIFSNFRKWHDNSLDRLLHVTGTGDDQEVRVVDEIVFGTLSVTEDKGKLQIASPDAGLALTVTFTNGTTTTIAATAANALNAKFVGSSGDGPLGILGAWSATAINVDLGNTDNDPMIGSFGADLTSFETLLP